LTSGNPTLDKNLECIGRYNPKLAKDLLNLPCLTCAIDLVETELGEPNLTYNGTPLHSQKGAEIEAKNAFDSAQNTPTSIHIVFGMGIGHLFQIFCEQSKGVVCLYEPNLEILRVTLELVDFSKELSQKNVRIASDMEMLKRYLQEGYTYKANSVFISLSTYREILYPDKIDEIVRTIETAIGSRITDYNTLKAGLTLSNKILMDNISYTLEETPLNEFKDFYKGKTALIVSAGPSLDKNIEIIKKNRDKVVIFCVGTAFKSLEKNGIKPDFVNLIEMHDCSSQVKNAGKEFDLSDINFIIEPYTNTSIHKLKTRQTLIFPSNSNPTNNYWSELTGVDNSPYVTKGTVSFEAIFSAKIMGFSKIILVGQDLAYANNQCYSKDAAYSDLVFDINPETGRPEFKLKDKEHFIEGLVGIGLEKQSYHNDYADFKIQNLNDTLMFVKSITGEMIPTQAGYATFIEHFEGFARDYGGTLNLINTSMLGAQIDGFKNITLEEALKDLAAVETKQELPIKHFKYDKERILKLLEEKKDNLENILKEFEKAKEYIYKYKREYNKRKELTLEAGRYFKLLLSLYIKINKEHQDPVYQACSFDKQIEIEYLLKKTENVEASDIEKLCKFLEWYFVDTDAQIQIILTGINQQKELISESLNPES